MPKISEKIVVHVGRDLTNAKIVIDHVLDGKDLFKPLMVCYGEKTCISLDDRGYCSKDWYQSNGYQIISFEEFLQTYKNKVTNNYQIC